MYWKTIENIKITDLRKCLLKLKKKYIVSPWIEDIINKNKSKKYKKSTTHKKNKSKSLKRHRSKKL